MEIRHPIRSASAGFTLIELMITVVVMAVLLGIGVPSFVDTIRNNRLASASNEFITALTMARSEASKRGIQVSVCIRDTEDKCATGTTDWSSGWLVFTDDLAPAGQIDGPTDVVLLSSATRQASVSMTGGANSITFTPFGALATQTITVTKSGCQGKNRRVITVQPTGRVALVKGDC
jgi:type IV fimbrial biogenesis protein FimT